MSFEPHNYLRHILAESDYLLQESAHLTLEQFVASGTLQRAFVRSLEIIGEASKKVPDAYRAPGPAHPQLFRRGLRIGVGCSHDARTVVAQSDCRNSSLILRPIEWQQIGRPMP